MTAIETFMSKEIKDSLFDRELFNIKYWEYLRPAVSCIVDANVSNTTSPFANKRFSLKKYFIKLKYIKHYFLKKKKSDILIASFSRREFRNDKYFNIYTDYYNDFLKRDYSITTIEEPIWIFPFYAKSAHNFPLYSDNYYLTDLHELSFFIRKFIYKIIHPKKYKKILEEYKFVSDKLNLWYSINSISFKNFFIEVLIKLDIDRKYIKKILNSVSPKLVMLYYMPSVFNQMLVNECNNLGIKTVEIQHGTITKVDPIINKCLDVSKVKTNTDYIFSFGENQVDKYALYLKNNKNVINVGSPNLESIRNKGNKKTKKYILVISQGTIGKDMAKFASKLADLLTDKKIVFKYHPSEFSNNFECLKKKNIIEIKGEKSIYDIQKESFIQIGAYSTALYEGFGLKVPTFIINSVYGSSGTLNIFKNIKRGVYYIDKPSDILKYIDKHDLIPLDKDINKLWTLNSKKRILQEVKKLMR